MTPLERFAAKCAFDPTTGCVMWVGGTTSGHGHNQPYGSFWDDKRRWFAHRWSAAKIHGHIIDGLQVDHCCPHGPSTLCVEHVEPQTGVVNNLLRDTRPGRAFQTLETRKYWLFVSKGLEPYREPVRVEPNIPLYTPPAWILPFMPPALLEEFQNIWPR